MPEATERLSFKLTSEGRIDTSSLRKSTEEKARTAISKSVADPDFRKWAGLEGTLPEVAPPQIISGSLIGNLLDLQVNIESALLAKKTGLPYEEVHKVLAWNVREHDVLDEQGAKLANKYIPTAWLEKADIFIFLATIVSLTTMKMNALKDYAKDKFNRQVSAPSHDEKKAEKEEPSLLSMERPHPGSAASNGAAA